MGSVKEYKVKKVNIEKLKTFIRKNKNKKIKKRTNGNSI
tara:strand:+ start:417 stop:533 length:117 start_codon:yes stop_codon:yes gene_type:complete